MLSVQCRFRVISRVPAIAWRRRVFSGLKSVLERQQNLPAKYAKGREKEKNSRRGKIPFLRGFTRARHSLVAAGV